VAGSPISRAQELGQWPWGNFGSGYAGLGNMRAEGETRDRGWGEPQLMPPACADGPNMWWGCRSVLLFFGCYYGAERCIIRHVGPGRLNESGPALL